MGNNSKFVDWMVERVEERFSSVSSKDLATMVAMIAKYSYNNDNEDQLQYTEEEQRSLDAAEVVYLLGM